MTMDELKQLLEQIIDPTVGKTLKESYGIKHIGYDDEKDVVTLIISIGKLGDDNEKVIR